jgi:hypothetical protein
MIIASELLASEAESVSDGPLFESFKKDNHSSKKKSH